MINHHFDDYDLSTNDDRRAVKDLLNLKFNQRCKSVENHERSGGSKFRVCYSCRSFSKQKLQQQIPGCARPWFCQRKNLILM